MDKYINELHIDGLAQDCSNSSALARDLLQSCAEPSNYAFGITNKFLG